jgi:DNA polymerase-3 subunit delta
VAEKPPVVYLLYGEDEFSKAEFINLVLGKMGDATMTELNITRLDGRTANLADLENAVRVMPFLLPRRLVILTAVDAMLKNKPLQKLFLEKLAVIPQTTALVINIDRPMVEKRRGDQSKKHWLADWADQVGERSYVKDFPLPVGIKLVEWIQRRVEGAGGKINYQAADELARLVGAELRILDHEIEKLLVYVNFSRPVEIEDVQHLTPDTARLPDFTLVNALRDRDGGRALQALHRELEEKDAIPLFQGIVTQFRQLLLVREIQDQGGGEQDAARLLGIHPYVAKMNFESARQFSLTALEAIYRRLLEVDTEIKTGQVEAETALDLLVARWCT